MNEIQNDWIDAVPVLLAIARMGSATAAGEQLRLSTATTLRRIQKLEEALGVQLFQRSPTGLRPTPALALAIPWAEQIEAAAHGMIRELYGLESQPEGTVRLALMSGLSNWFIAPAVPRLRTKHPKIVLELVPATALVDLAQRQADLALRTIRPEGQDLVVHELVQVPMQVFAAQALLKTIKPKTLSDLPWLDWDHNRRQGDESRWLAGNVSKPHVVLRCSEITTLIRAAQEGVGAVLLGTQLAVAAGGLMPVSLPAPPTPKAQIYLVAHPAVRPVPRIAAVWEWILDEFRDPNASP